MQFKREETVHCNRSSLSHNLFLSFALSSPAWAVTALFNALNHNHLKTNRLPLWGKKQKKSKQVFLPVAFL